MQTLSDPVEPIRVQQVQARGVLYALASRLLLPPDQDLAGVMADGSLVELARQAAGDLGSSRIAEIIGRIESAWRAMPGATLVDLAESHERTFGQATTTDRPPYEAMYGNRAGDFGETQDLANVSGYYRAFGVALGGGARERPDHVAIESEFVGYLCHLEAWAAAHGHLEQSSTARSAVKAFLLEHLGTFAGPFARRTQQTAAPGVHLEAACLLEAVVDEHRRALGVRPTERCFIPVPCLDEGEMDGDGFEGGAP